MRKHKNFWDKNADRYDRFMRKDRAAYEEICYGHIHKTPDQELVDRFCKETRAMRRKSAHQEEAQPVPCQMINCFCMYSDYTPLTLEEWIECDRRRRNKVDRSETLLCALDEFSTDFMSDGRCQ